MSHGSTEHNLEEAHHAEHASHDNFTRNVAMTMAILAAGLAFVTLISHRQHNETIQRHIESNDKLTEAANRWNYYQAKKNRAYSKEDFAESLEVTARAPAPDTAEAKKVVAWKNKAEQYQRDAAKQKEKAEKVTGESREKAQEAHLSHLTSNFFDVGHLGLELALVLCSLAVLTRKSAFWYGGIGIGALGLCIALSGFYLPAKVFHEEPAATSEEGDAAVLNPTRWPVSGRT